MLPAIPPTKRKCMCFSCQTLTTLTGQYPFVEIVPLPLTILLISSFLHLLSILFQNCLPALCLTHLKKTLCATAVPSLSFLIPSTVLFLFCPLLFSGISCSATSSDIWWKRKKQIRRSSTFNVRGLLSFCRASGSEKKYLNHWVDLCLCSHFLTKFLYGQF